MALEKNDSVKQTAPAGHDSTSHTLLAEVHNLHVDSFNRNKSDNAASVALGTNADKSGIALADKTIAQSAELQHYLAGGGNFKDAAGKEMGKQFLTQLHRETASHKADKAGAEEYVGEKLPENVRKMALVNADVAGQAARVSASGVMGQHDSASFLDLTKTSTQELVKGLSEANCAPGKDQKDAISEGKVILGDVAALQGAKLTPEQKKMLFADISSKTRLIRNEMNDIPNEIGEIKHDNAAIASGGKLESLVRGAMSGRSGNLDGLKSELAGLSRADGSGVLDAVKKDRNADAYNEQVYMKANLDDNKQNNAHIIEFSSPFAKAEKR